MTPKIIVRSAAKFSAMFNSGFELEDWRDAAGDGLSALVTIS